MLKTLRSSDRDYDNIKEGGDNDGVRALRL